MNKNFIVSAILAVSLTACESSTEDKVETVHSGLLTPLEIHGFDNEVVGAFQVEVADTYEERAQGLMYRTSMANDRGMLFVWERPHFYKMWMKNTEISLDMLFIKHDTILDMALGTKPHSLEELGGVVSVDKVLELPAGRVEALRIQVGHTISYGE